MSPTRPVTVRGGSNGIEAHYEAITAMARQLGLAASDLGERSVRMHAFLLDPALVTSAVLDPPGVAVFEATLLAGLDGRGGLSWQAVLCAQLDVSARAAAAAYQQADRLAASALPSARAVSPFVVADATLAALAHLVGSDARITSGDDWAGAANRFVTTDPGLADAAMTFGSDFWLSWLSFHIIAAHPDGRPIVTARGVDPSAPISSPPRTVQDLFTGLAHRNRTGPDGEDVGGDIDVRILTSTTADGRPQRRVIVDIPGTKSWRLDTPDVTSLGTNARAVEGRDTTYQEGVLSALRLAGVTSSDTVLMIGHSLGGLVAVNTAAAMTRTHEFNVAHVITAGSPIARLPVPRSVDVLALENDGDIVPHADGATNPDRRNVTTVQTHRNTGDVLANHDLDASYIAGAGDVDASGDPSVRSYLASIRPFLDGEQITTEVFHVERGG